MNTNTNENTGTVSSELVNTVVNNIVNNNTPKRRGRKPNMSLIRKLYLNDNNLPRSKGAPRPNSTVRYVEVYKGLHNKDFVFNDKMEVKTEIVSARQYKAKTADITVHSSANGIVTQSEDNIVVDNNSAQVSQQVAA